MNAAAQAPTDLQEAIRRRAEEIYIRNGKIPGHDLENWAQAEHEIMREFTEPAPGLIGDAYRFYCQKVLPKIGGLISGDSAAYAYLPKSVARFFHPNELAGLMRQVGYANVRFILMMLNSVALHIAVKSA